MYLDNFGSGENTINNQEGKLRSTEEIVKELTAVRQEKGRLMQARQTPTSTAFGGEADQINEDWRKINIVEELLVAELDKAKARQKNLTEKFEGTAANADEFTDKVAEDMSQGPEGVGLFKRTA
jgi:hypothetical protein